MAECGKRRTLITLATDTTVFEFEYEPFQGPPMVPVPVVGFHEPGGDCPAPCMEYLYFSNWTAGQVLVSAAGRITEISLAEPINGSTVYVAPPGSSIVAIESMGAQTVVSGDKYVGQDSLSQAGWLLIALEEGTQSTTEVIMVSLPELALMDLDSNTSQNLPFGSTIFCEDELHYYDRTSGKCEKRSVVSVWEGLPGETISQLSSTWKAPSLQAVEAAILSNCTCSYTDYLCLQLIRSSHETNTIASVWPLTQAEDPVHIAQVSTSLRRLVVFHLYEVDSQCASDIEEKYGSNVSVLYGGNIPQVTLVGQTVNTLGAHRQSLRLLIGF